MKMTSSPKHGARFVAPVALLGLSVAATPALAQDRLTVDVSASAGISTNPFLEAGPTPTAANATIGLRPSWVSERPLTTLRVDGNAEVTFYDQGYGTNESVNVQGSGTHKLSEYTSINAAIGYINTIVGSFNDLNGFNNLGTPITAPVLDGSSAGGVPVVGTPVASGIDAGLPVFVTDPTLSGIGRRRQAYLASGGISTLISARDRADLSVAASINRSGGADFADFTYVAPTASYSRTIGAGFTVGANFTVGFTDYRNTNIGDATIYQPTVTVTHLVGERWSLAASAGVAIVNLNDIDGESRTSTSAIGSASLCRKDIRWNACFTASRQTLPSSFQGVRTQTSAGASFDYRLNPRDNLSAYAGYSRAGSPIQRDVIGVRDGAVEFVNASATYSHRFASAFSGFVTAGYSKAFDDFIKRDANLTALAGVTYGFGRQP